MIDQKNTLCYSAKDWYCMKRLAAPITYTLLFFSLFVPRVQAGGLGQDC